MDILKFLTAGSVDDGKSTLIGRLLYDSKNILIDQMQALERSTKQTPDGNVDLALLTDGLRAEREQGITIDVAYKYFSTPSRKFIIADAPGHIQYTRNMVTGASNSDLIIILIDARNGVIEQTKRHSIIASLLGIPSVIVAINKMDLIQYDQERYDAIVREYQQVAQELSLKNVQYIPISALKGDNVVEKSPLMPWYTGSSLLEMLETVQIPQDPHQSIQRMPVQLVLRPQTDALHDYRGYAGRIESGIFKVGDPVRILPSDIRATIKGIEEAGKDLTQAEAPQSVVIHLNEDIDISRGDLIAGFDDALKLSNQQEAIVCWLGEAPLQPRNKYLLQHNTRVVQAMITQIEYKIDVNTLKHEAGGQQIALNEVAKVHIKTAKPLAYDAYQQVRNNGGAILIDATSYATVGAVLFS